MLNASRRSGSTARADHKRKGFTCRPRELPWIAEGQPFLRVFLLPTVLDDLAEQSVIVANAVAVGGNSEGRHALHETGGEPTKAAMAEGRVRLSCSQPV